MITEESVKRKQFENCDTEAVKQMMMQYLYTLSVKGFSSFTVIEAVQ